MSPRKTNLSKHSRKARFMRLTRFQESQEHYEERLAAGRYYAARAHASETSDQREARLKRQRAHIATSRSLQKQREARLRKAETVFLKMEANSNMTVFSHVKKSDSHPVPAMIQIVKTDIDDGMTASSSDLGAQRAVIFQISSAAETVQAIRNIPNTPASAVSQPQGVVEQVFMYDMPMNLKEEVPDAVEDSESNEEDEQNEGDEQNEEAEQNEEDQNEQSVEVEGRSEVESEDDASPEETAYLNYFRGLLPDYLKLNADRKELFRKTLTQILGEQTES